MKRRSFVGHLAGSALAGPLAASFAQNPSSRPVPIRVGQIGVGHAHAGKLSVYRSSPDYEVVGIVETDEVLRKQVESQPAFRDLPWMTEEQLLNVPGLQVVLVETRVRDLLPVAERCVAAGRHIHLDKPAGESLQNFRHVLDEAARRRLLVQMGYMYRYSPAVVQLRDFLRRGWLGEPFEVHAVMSKTIAAAERKQLSEYRGGTMFELGCHLIDLIVSLLGKPSQVTAFPRRVADSSDNLIDNMLAVLGYDRATASVRSSALEVEGFERRHLVVCGTEGTFHIQPLDNPQARVALSQPRGDHRRGYQEIQYPRFTRFVADAADMARIVRGEKESDFSYEHDLTVQEVLLRACGRT